MCEKSREPGLLWLSINHWPARQYKIIIYDESIKSSGSVFDLLEQEQEPCLTMASKSKPSIQYYCSSLLWLVLVISNAESVSVRERRNYSHNFLVKQINRKGPYIGLITVFSPEEKSFFATGAFNPHPQHPFVDLSGRRFRVGEIYNKKVIYVRCGVGIINAAAAAQQMMDVFDVTGIIHFGIAGNANDSMSIGDVVIPQKFIHTGLWEWLNPNGTLNPSDDFSHLDIGDYNEPKKGNNELGRIGYYYVEFYSQSGEPDTATPLMWANTDPYWLKLAATLEGMELERCVNSSYCLTNKPKLVVGLKGSTANSFVDNAAYRDFLFNTIGVSSLDMESSAIVMTSLSNGLPVIVIRGLSDLAGAQEGKNPYAIYGPLAASNAAKAVVQFLKILSTPGKLEFNNIELLN